MITISSLPVLLQLAATLASPPRVYHGRQQATEVAIPRVEAEARVDGALDEPVWQQAAVLTGFSQYQPVDGLPAADSTEVLVWYTSHALYIGIRALEPHGVVNATLADRDRIFDDDYVQLLLDTFNDRRRALLFAVNPLGVQADGYQTEEQRSNQMFGAAESSGRIDLSADFVFESKGRVTPNGYEVELRIPFKSLRYPSTQPQTWGINIVRRVQHSGFVQTWTPVKSGATSFLAQSGSLVGMAQMRRGLVFDATPELTNQVLGSERSDGWGYRQGDPQAGVTARWGITTDLTLSGTANPDYSQVEADVAQIQFDPRQALSFPEKRPFFLEGNEYFASPNNLIYTRRIADPLAAVKLGGKFSGMDIGYLAALDDEALSRSGEDRPRYNIVRIRRPVGTQSALGFTYTDRVEGAQSNRVASVDSRLVLSGRYTLGVQLAGSRTHDAAGTRSAPLWDFSLRRSGREFGWNFALNGRDPDFVAGSGFVGRPGLAHASFTPRMTRFGKPGALVESWSSSLTGDLVWEYDRFTRGVARGDESKLHWNNSLQLRGGWQAGASVLVENFLLPPGLYDDYYVDLGNDTVPFVGRPSINNYDFVATLATPQWQTFSSDIFLLWGRDENFAEWAPGYILWATWNGSWRPTERVRVAAIYNETRVLRPDDWSVVTLTQIPRLKLEYQLARPVFVRLVGQYIASKQDALQDDGRTERPILRRRTDGTFAPTLAERDNQFRFDWLFSYTPTPGTVLFAGYGSTLADSPAERMFALSPLRRSEDGFFVKLSYLVRL